MRTGDRNASGASRRLAPLRRLCLAGLLAFSIIPAPLLVSSGAALAVETGAKEEAPVFVARDPVIAGDAKHTRIVLRFDGKPDPQWFLLRDPSRLVIDFARTRFDLDPAKLAPQGLVAHVRYGNIQSGRSRFIVSASGPFSVEQVDVVANDDGDGSRLIVDLAATDAQSFDEQMRRHLGAPEIAVADEKGIASKPEGAGPQRRFTVVLDPGHGGIDGGTQGADGLPEKTITLAFALELRKKLLDTGAFNVVMTRDSDDYVSLDGRVEIARKNEADLFISMHADAIRLKSLRGATIYTVSDKASDAAAASTAARENLSDALAGIEIQQEKDDVADILVDLTRRETHSFSMRFARFALTSLSKSINMIDTNPHRYAGFRVLRAVDVPSVLIELGYLSNRTDEKLLRDADWRAKAADSLVDAIEKFAGARARVGG